ncbi:unnamed protein product [Sphagnum tenellum]
MASRQTTNQSEDPPTHPRGLWGDEEEEEEEEPQFEDEVARATTSRGIGAARLQEPSEQDDSWESQLVAMSNAPPTRGVGRPRSEVERLEELRREGRNVREMVAITDEGDNEWADIENWEGETRGPTPPPMEGVVAPSLYFQEEVARTFDLGEGEEKEESLRKNSAEAAASSSRGVGRPRHEVERLELLRQAGINVPEVVVASKHGETWAETRSWDGGAEEQAAYELQRPVREGMLSPHAQATDVFAETYNWGEEEYVNPQIEWEEAATRGKAERGIGSPISPSIRMQHERRHSISTKLESEQQRQTTTRGQDDDNSWAITLPQGDAVRRGDAVQEWATVLAPTGIIPILEHGELSDHEKASNATTPSSFDSKKEFKIVKEISLRFLPAFANEENRAFNFQVQEAERALKDVEDATEEQNDRTMVMEDHMKRVQEEIAATQMRVEAKRQEILAEQHLKTMCEFQVQRTKREVLRFENEMHEMMEKLQSIQTSIMQGNEKMDQIRLVQHWNQEEMEQWVQAARQKEEDSMALASYTKSDTSRIKELQLEETKASKELASLEHLLENEMSETQSHQIQLDRTAEEFRKLHLDRQKIIQMWEDAIELIHQRDKDIHKITAEFANNKGHLRRGRRILDNLDLKYYNAVEHNKDIERAIYFKELDAQKQREQFRSESESTTRTHEELALMKTNHLRTQYRFAKILGQKVHLQEEIKRQNKKYEQAKEKLQKMRKQVEEEYNHLDTLEKRTHALEKLLSIEELNLKLVKQEVIDLRERHFKASEELFSLKAAEVNTIHEIAGGKSQAKNLGSKINQLELDMMKQEEKLYVAEFQIQLMERKVGQASGERNNLEEIETTKMIKELENHLDEVKREEASAIAQLKKSQNDLRAATQKKEELEKKCKHGEEKNDELNTECDSGHVTNKTLIAEREEKSLEVDLLQMEVNRLTDLLHFKADEVFNMDCLKQRLQKNMDDRRREVDARQLEQRQDLKLIQEELHNLIIKRKNCVLFIEKLHSKYDCLKARTKSSDGVELTADYYFQKVVKDREEVQRKGIELEKRFIKAKVDVDFLKQATSQIVESNNNLRTSLDHNNPKIIELENEAKSLKSELAKSRDSNRFKEREKRLAQEEVAEAEARLEKSGKEYESLSNSCIELQRKTEMAEKDAQEQSTKCKRAASQLNLHVKDLKEKLSIAVAKQVGSEFILAELRETVKDVLYKLRQLTIENPDYAPIIEKQVTAEGFKLPLSSGRSSQSGSSNGSVSSKNSGDDAGPSGQPAKKGGKSSTGGRIVKVEFQG